MNRLEKKISEAEDWDRERGGARVYEHQQASLSGCKLSSQVCVCVCYVKVERVKSQMCLEYLGSLGVWFMH